MFGSTICITCDTKFKYDVSFFIDDNAIYGSDIFKTAPAILKPKLGET